MFKLFVSLTALWAGWLPADVTATTPTPISVAVSVPPQAYFVDRIGGPLVQTEVLIPPGSSPATYAPSPRQMVALGKAKLYVLVGHPAFVFESKHIRPFLATHPSIRSVELSNGVPFIEHGHEGDRHSAEGDPHLWVAPATVRVAAGNIARALMDLDPDHAAEYEANLQGFLADIDALDREIRAALRGLKQRRFMVYHPAWGYFAREYGLVQVAIETGGKEPGPAHLLQLMNQAREEGIEVIFVQKGFSSKSARIIARQIGATVREVDPLAYDWLANMRQVARAFRDAMAH